MRKGYTLIELLIVLAISAMLVAIAVSYTGAARSQTALSVESAGIANTIFEAKNLSLATYGTLSEGNSPKVCGYGVSVDYRNNTYSLFEYEPLPANYPDLRVRNGFLVFCPSVASTTAKGITQGIYPKGEMGEYSATVWNVPLSESVVATTTGNPVPLSLVLFIPPNPSTLISENGVSFVTIPSQIRLVSTANGASTAVKVSNVGEITF